MRMLRRAALAVALVPLAACSLLTDPGPPMWGLLKTGAGLRLIQPLCHGEKIRKITVSREVPDGYQPIWEIASSGGSAEVEYLLGTVPTGFTETHPDAPGAFTGYIVVSVETDVRHMGGGHEVARAREGLVWDGDGYRTPAEFIAADHCRGR